MRMRVYDIVGDFCDKKKLVAFGPILQYIIVSLDMTNSYILLSEAVAYFSAFYFFFVCFCFIVIVLIQ